MEEEKKDGAEEGDGAEDGEDNKGGVKWREGRGWRGAGDSGGVSIIPVMVAGASIKASVLSEKKAENIMESG